MNREKSLESIKEFPNQWDVIIIGGGATGLGAAVDSASRGFKTLLLEQHDFAKGTSSRSTKLIHGGLRYLQQGNLSLVTEALRERGLLCENAPHLVHPLPFLVPNYKWWEGTFYGAGVKIYDFLAGSHGLEPSEHLNKQETLQKLPTLKPENLRGGVVYHDGQFDDARLAISLARTATDLGGVLLNYMKVSALIKKEGKCVGVKATDLESDKEYKLEGRVVINATGAFSDKIRLLDDKKSLPLIAPSRGTHIVLSKDFLPSNTALLIPYTEDKRVLFFVPWHDKIIVGTTDISVSTVKLEPVALKKEITFLLKHAAHYLVKAPKESDVLSVFTGIRPLVKADETKPSSSLSRDHRILVSSSDLISIVGGKWTTYRQMAEDVINKAINISSLPSHPCITKTLPLHGFLKEVNLEDPWSVYGTDCSVLDSILKNEKASLDKKIHPDLLYKQVEVIFAARREMARTVEDVLARRTRSLFLNARASIEAAPLVAQLLAKELGRSKSWELHQVKEFKEIASNYLLR
jgi:glycerol-3-phosphate dehydrogenase